MQARSQKILLGSAFEEKVDLLKMQYSLGAVEEIISFFSFELVYFASGSLESLPMLEQ